jgi:nucleoside-diphosphate-sugar epimerase
MTKTGKTALVLGATGGIGGAVAARLARDGWHIRALHRNVATVRRAAPHYQWIAGDAMRPADVLAAARGADLIVHAVNPPGYRNWGELVLPMIDSTIAAAEAVGATILLPGTVYNYGPDAFPRLSEDSPQNPLTSKGRIRVELEQRLAAASERGVGVIIVRAGDFFGPGAANSWFSQGMVTAGKPVRSMIAPTARGIGHQWAYLPDVAETMVQLVDIRETLPRFARYHMDGVWDPDGMRLIQAVARITGRKPRVWRFPWALLPLLSPFVPFLKELREMRYLWMTDIRMDNSRLVATLGAEPQTPLDLAMRRTLEYLGCVTSLAPEARTGQMPLDAVSGTITTPPIR